MISYKKALQPPHPSEAVVGQFFRNLPCQRCIPLYPLRYALTERPFDRTALPHLDTTGYPPLQGNKPYGLRVLRPGSYVYLFYFKGGRMWTQHYQVTEDARFAALWWSAEDEADPTPGRHSRPDVFGATAYIPAPETNMADTVWLLVSETLLSHSTLWQIEQDTHQLRSRLATAVKPAAGGGQPHTLLSTQLGEQVPELAAPGLTSFQPHTLRPGAAPLMPWSEQQSLPLKAPRIEAEMRRALMMRTDLEPLVVVLHDPIGLTSELNYLATQAVQAKTRFAADNAHKLTSAQLIKGYFEQNHPLHMSATLAEQKELVKWSELQHFRDTYAQRLAVFEPPIERAVADVSAWVRLLQTDQSLKLAFRCFDLTVLGNAQAYEETVFQCIGALVHSEPGRRQLAALIDAPVDTSPYWQAVSQGNPDLLFRLAKSSDVSKSVFNVLDTYLEEHAATPATNALVTLFQALPDAHRADVLVRRLRHVLEMRFNATLIEHEISLGKYLHYVRELEGFKKLGPELAQRWNLSVVSSLKADSVGVRVKIYEWVKVGETDYRVLDKAPAQRTALPPTRAVPLEGNPLIRALEKLRGPAGHLFVGVGGVAAVLGMWISINGLMKSPETSTVTSAIAATLTLIGSSIEVGAAGVAIAATRRGNTSLVTTAKFLSAKYGAATFGAAGAGVYALTDGINTANALRERNHQQARMYLGATLAGTALTLATAAGGIATASTLIGGAGVVAVLGLTPAGWAIVALIALGTAIYFTVKAEDAKHGPVATWLKHSAWGEHAKHYEHHEELDAFYSLLYRPRISADWESRVGSDIGLLTIDCTLPSSMEGERFAWKLKVTLDQQALTLIEGPIVHAMGHPGIDYRRQYLLRRDEEMGSHRDWKITMHESAQVSLEYLYHPNFSEQPDLALTQPNAPAPLVFTSSGWFSDPIDESILEPVKGPA